MIYWITKHWRLFFDIILVIGAILIFTFWDPFGIFTNNKTKPTASLLTSIKDIGQLVTAEYHGEVISSWKDYKAENVLNSQVQQFADKNYRQINYMLYNQLNGALPEITSTNDQLLDCFIAFCIVHSTTRKIEEVYDLKRKNINSGFKNGWLQSQKNQLINEQTSVNLNFHGNEVDAKKTLLNFMDALPSYVSGFHEYYYRVFEDKQDSRSDLKKNIVIIGRGTVKAGFDFGQLDESNLYYNEGDKIVHFYGILPIILDSDINPWFIPERKVKGFELVDYNGEVDFNDAKLVKVQCKQKLLDQAKQADIINLAKVNGEEALKSFFSILLDEPNIAIALHSLPYEDHFSAINGDSLINLTEANFILDLYQSELKRFKTLTPSAEQNASQQLRIFIHKLKKLPIYNKNYQFNYYSCEAAKVLRDTFFVSKPDWDGLNHLKDSLYITEQYSLATSLTSAHPIWFEYSDFQKEYNETLELIAEAADSIEIPLKNLYYDVLLNDLSDQKIKFLSDSTKITNSLILHAYEYRIKQNHKKTPISLFKSNITEILSSLQTK